MAGKINATYKGIRRKGADHDSMIEVRLECTADSAAATYPAYTLKSKGGNTIDLTGYFLYSAKAWPGATAPTDATDLTITDIDGVDLLGGRGTDFIDATSKTSTSAGTLVTDMPMPITSNLTITITNNAVNSAVCYIKLLFIESIG